MSMSIYIDAPAPSLVIAAGAVLPFVCTIAVILRLSNSRFIDDWLTVPALILLWGQGICLIYGTSRHALAYDDPDPAPPGVNPDDWTSPEDILSSQLFYSILLVQVPCITLVKLAFTFFYRRIFVSRSGSNQVLPIMLHVLAGLLTAWGISFFFAELFICRGDFRAIWLGTNDEQAEECLPFDVFDQAFAASDFIFDLIVFLIPIPLVWRLKMSNGRRWAILGVFSLGGLSVAAAITRLVVFTYEADLGFTICVYWTAVESGIALLASCLPSVYGLLNNRRRKLSERSHTYVNTEGSGSGKGVWSALRRASTSWKERSRLGSDATANSLPLHDLDTNIAKTQTTTVAHFASLSPTVFVDDASTKNLVKPAKGEHIRMSPV